MLNSDIFNYTCSEFPEVTFWPFFASICQNSLPVVTTRADGDVRDPGANHTGNADVPPDTGALASSPACFNKTAGERLRTS